EEEENEDEEMEVVDDTVEMEHGEETMDDAEEIVNEKEDVDVENVGPAAPDSEEEHANLDDVHCPVTIGDVLAEK
ncbi:hypothetical protein PENTCL1PPCAC_8633, partial [Pristionchus entomophagus]